MLCFPILSTKMVVVLFYLHHRAATSLSSLKFSLLNFALKKKILSLGMEFPSPHSRCLAPQPDAAIHCLYGYPISHGQNSYVTAPELGMAAHCSIGDVLDPRGH